MEEHADLDRDFEHDVSQPDDRRYDWQVDPYACQLWATQWTFEMVIGADKWLVDMDTVVDSYDMFEMFVDKEQLGSSCIQTEVVQGNCVNQEQLYVS